MAVPTGSLWVLVAVVALSAGCLQSADPDGAEAPTYRVSGHFTEEATQDQMERLGAEARRLGGDMMVLESFPAQFDARGFSDEACEEFRSYAEVQPYVSHVGGCQVETAPASIR